MGNKTVGGTIGATISSSSTCAGIALMSLGGPPGIIAGGIILGAGISSGVNTI